MALSGLIWVLSSVMRPTELPSEVIQLNSDSFGMLTPNAKNVAILFTGQAYEYSQFHNSWEETARAFKARLQPLTFATVNCKLAINEDLCSAFNVNVFPTVAVFNPYHRSIKTYPVQGMGLVKANSIEMEDLINFLVLNTDDRSRVMPVLNKAQPPPLEGHVLRPDEVPAMFPAYLGRTKRDRLLTTPSLLFEEETTTA
jgi:hypothetical protein